jgi:hypothetical protein
MVLRDAMAAIDPKKLAVLKQSKRHVTANTRC